MITIAQPTAIKTPPSKLTTSKALKRIAQAFLLFILLCGIFASSALPFTSFLPSSVEKAYATPTTSGTWGTCNWDIDNGTLTIHAGTGADTVYDIKECIPWYDHRTEIKAISIFENVIAPADISYLFAGMWNLVSADLSGLDTSNVTNMDNVFTNCSQLSKRFISKDKKHGPYSAANCATAITDETTGWYDVGNVWGTCLWDINNGVLTIHEGVGRNITDNVAPYLAPTLPWAGYSDQISEVVITENVVAPEDLSYMFYRMKNLAKADLTGLDSSNVTTAKKVFIGCENLTTIKIGSKTFAKNIFTGLTNKGFMSQDGKYGPYSAGNCATLITEKNTSWYDVIPVNLWGDCIWEINDGVLMIRQGTGADTASSGSTNIPWRDDCSSITEIIVSKDVIAPGNISYMFRNMTNLKKVDLSELDTTSVVAAENVFSNCPNLTSINIGPKTLATNILTGLDGKALIPQSGGDPILPTDLPTVITAGNAGWYNVVDAD